MAACTFAVGTADTGADPNTSGDFTPASNDLLVVMVGAAATAEAAPTLASSVGGQTFQFVVQQLNAAGNNSMYLFVANALSTNVLQNVTVDCGAADRSGGTCIMVYRVSGMSKTGSAAVRQTKGANAASGTPAITFDTACLTGNPTIGAVLNNTSPAGITANGSWTEPAGGDIGFSNPTFGTAVCHRDSGFTGTGVTWGGASPSAFAVLMVELDASAAAAGLINPLLGKFGGLLVGKLG